MDQKSSELSRYNNALKMEISGLDKIIPVKIFNPVKLEKLNPDQLSSYNRIIDSMGRMCHTFEPTEQQKKLAYARVMRINKPQKKFNRNRRYKTKIICLRDEVEDKIYYFAIKNGDWPIERLVEEYCKRNGLSELNDYAKGHMDSFIDFIKRRNAVEVKIPIIILNSYPDPDYRD